MDAVGAERIRIHPPEKRNHHDDVVHDLGGHLQEY
jgi:hypothetical protein